MASSTLRCMRALTRFLPLTTAEAVALDTPANRATSRSVAKPDDSLDTNQLPSAWRSRRMGLSLERVSQPHLHNSRIPRCYDSPKQRRRPVAVRIVQIDPVEQVEKLRPELQAVALFVR